MPKDHFRMMRLLAMSGLLVLATFTSAKAQEPPVNPNITDIELPQKRPAELQPVSQLAQPEIDYPDCGPVPGAWHPPIYYPNPTLGCPTGVVHRDWWREKTLCHHIRHRQRMLEKDDLWRAQNAGQPTCCPPPSCWGHSCECCPGIGCLSRCFGLSWLGLGRKCGFCQSSCGETPCSEGSAYGTISGSGSSGDPVSNEAAAGEPVPGDQTSAAELAVPAWEPAAPALLVPEPLTGRQTRNAVALLPIEQPEEAEANNTKAPSESIILVGNEQPACASGVCGDSAGYCTVSDNCTSGGRCMTGNCFRSVGGGWAGSPHCPLGARSYFCPPWCKKKSGSEYCYDNGFCEWDDCEEDHCHCVFCRLCHCCKAPYCHLCNCLYADCHLCKCLYSEGGQGYCRWGGGWNREVPAIGQYYMAYPVNPYHFDQRDGRIYAAQGYGYPVGVPLAPNVEHTYNYGWGIPSSRLTPVSRMPGAPGVANPAAPNAAGPGVWPPGYLAPRIVPGSIQIVPENASTNGSQE